MPVASSRQPEADGVHRVGRSRGTGSGVVQFARQAAQRPRDPARAHGGARPGRRPAHALRHRRGSCGAVRQERWKWVEIMSDLGDFESSSASAEGIIGGSGRRWDVHMDLGWCGLGGLREYRRGEWLTEGGRGNNLLISCASLRSFRPLLVPPCSPLSICGHRGGRLTCRWCRDGDSGSNCR